MPCYSPLHAYEGKVNANGRIDTVWSRRDSPEGVRRDLPCGQCIGCRLEYSRKWAVRLMHEASLHEENSFLTLTYDRAHLPTDGSLQVRDFQLFMKRLRKMVRKPLRFFHCGEYGEKVGRPHYHCILFGYDFPDKRLYTVRGGNKLYQSPSLDVTWGMGYASVGDVSFESAAYVARYCVKKVTNKESYVDRKGVFRPSVDLHYLDVKTGVVREREYVTMSRGGRTGLGGIGKGWYEKFKSDVFPADEVIVNGVATRPPRFYESLLSAENPDLLEELKAARRLKCRHESDVRLLVAEEVKLAQIRSLKRSMEVSDNDY